MTMDRTLRTHGALVRSRSVLTRAERIDHMIEDGKFDPEKDNPFALPKTKIRHSKAGTKTKKAEEPAAEAPVEGAEEEGAEVAEDRQAKR